MSRSKANLPIELHQQVKLEDSVVRFHAETKWNTYDRPGESLRILKLLSDPVAIRKFALHGKTYHGYRKFELNRSHAKGTLDDALLHRASMRNMENAGLEIGELSELLVPAASRVREIEGGPAGLCAGPYPSAGGLYPVEIYILLNAGAINWPGIQGFLHFDGIKKRLSLIRHIDDINNCMRSIQFGTRMRRDFGAIVFLTAFFSRSTRKYGPRGYRFALLEAGHVAQNILLCSVAAGLNAYCWAGYDDDVVHDFLGIDGVEESVLHAVVVGRSSSAPPVLSSGVVSTPES